MKENFRKVKSIVHMVLLVLQLVFFGALIADQCIECGKVLVYTQLIDATYGGFLFLMFILCVGICLDEELERQTQMTVSYLGGIMHLTSAVFLCLAVDSQGPGERVTLALVASAILAGVHLFEAIYITLKKDLDQSV